MLPAFLAAMFGADTGNRTLRLAQRGGSPSATPVSTVPA